MPNRLTWRAAAGTIGFILLAFSLWRFKFLVGYMIAALALSFVGRPIVLLIQRIKIRGNTLPAAVGAMTALTTIVFAVGGVIRLFVPLFAEQADAIGRINADQVRVFSSKLTRWLDVDLQHFDFSGAGIENSTYLMGQLQSLVQLDGVGSLFGGLVARLGDGFIAIFSILFMTFFFLKDGALFRNMVQAIVPNGMEDRIQNILDRTTALLTRYFGGLVAQVFITTTIIALGLQLVGASHAFLIGMMAGILNLVPYVGPLAGTAIGLALVATGHTASPDALISVMGWSTLVFILAQFVDNFFTQPVIFANRVKAHPMEVFLVISIAGSLAGVAGMVLAIPAYTLFRIIAQELLSGFKVIDQLTKQL